MTQRRRARGRSLDWPLRFFLLVVMAILLKSVPVILVVHRIFSNRKFEETAIHGSTSELISILVRLCGRYVRGNR